MRRNTTSGRVKPSESSGNGFTVNGDLTVLDPTGGADEQVVISGDSISAATAPSRGVVSRDNICFAWGRFTVDVTGNTATLVEGHNIDTVTWSSDTAVAVVFHNTASSANHMINTGTDFTASTYASAVATTGFTFNRSAGGSNWTGYFSVFTKDIT